MQDYRLKGIKHSVRLLPHHPNETTTTPFLLNSAIPITVYFTFVYISGWRVPLNYIEMIITGELISFLSPMI